MQATEIKQLTINRFAVSALAVGIVAAAALGLIQVSGSGSRDDLATELPASPVTQARDTVTFEQNTQLPTGGSGDQTWSSNTDALDLQQAPMARPLSETNFHEQNTILPAGLTDSSATSRAESATTNR